MKCFDSDLPRKHFLGTSWSREGRCSGLEQRVYPKGKTWECSWRGDLSILVQGRVWAVEMLVPVAGFREAMRTNHTRDGGRRARAGSIKVARERIKTTFTDTALWKYEGEKFTYPRAGWATKSVFPVGRRLGDQETRDPGKK